MTTFRGLSPRAMQRRVKAPNNEMAPPVVLCAGAWGAATSIMMWTRLSTDRASRPGRTVSRRSTCPATERRTSG